MKRSVLIMVIPLLFLVIFASAKTMDDELIKLADRVMEGVSKIRDLEIKSPVSKGLKSRDEIKSYLVERIKEEYHPDEIEMEGRVLKKLGLIPKDMQMYEFVVSLLTEQVAGYYDPKTKTFYIADWLDAASQEPIMAHELTHALQDQHFDVRPFLQRIKGNDDAMLARSAILEGDAVAVMIEYVMKPLGYSFVDLPNLDQFASLQDAVTSKEYKVFASAPPYFKETLIFPYTAGLGFLQAYRKTNSWRKVGDVYGDLPKSTEQIMHPSKYMALRDDPTSVEEKTPSELAGRASWKQGYSNVLGEFSTFLLLKQFLGDDQAAREGADGWDGDSLQLFEGANGREAISFRSVWDSEEEAKEFFDAYARLVEKKFPDLKAEGESPRLVWKTSTGEAKVTLALSGAWVEVLEM